MQLIFLRRVQHHSCNSQSNNKNNKQQSGGIGQAHGVGQRIKATFSVSKSLCRKKIYDCLSTPPILLGAKQQA
jgi:hypothetical protein